jgi:hypothetical protein
VQRIEGTREAKCILIEHQGSRGRLALKGQPGKRTARVDFEDGSRRVVELSELRLIAWTAR